MLRNSLSLLMLFGCVGISLLHAQTPQELAAARESLLRDVSAMMESRVFPVMEQWKTQFESRLTPRERTALEALRDRYGMLRSILTNNLRARQAAWDKRDYASFTSLRGLLRTNFDDRQKLYGELSRFTERNEKPFQYLSARIDSTIEEWRGGAMRIFVDWFAKHRNVISLAMNSPSRDDLARLMASCKNIQLDELDPLSKVTFLLWDGEDYLPRIRERGIPESPLTDCGPDREKILFVEPASVSEGNAIVRFLLPVPAATTVRVLNMAGQTVQTLSDDTLPIGKHLMTVNARELSPGTYYVMVEADGLFDGVPLRVSGQ